MRKKMLAAAAVFALLGGQAATAAAPLSLAPAVRAGAQTQGEARLVGTTAWILGAIALGLLIWGIIELTDGEEDFPNSP